MIGMHNHNSGILISLCIILLLLFPQSCGSNNNSSSSGKKLAMRYAENLTLQESEIRGILQNYCVLMYFLIKE